MEKSNNQILNEINEHSLRTNIRMYRYNPDNVMSLEDLLNMGCFVNGDLIIMKDVPKKQDESSTNNTQSYYNQIYVVVDNELVLAKEVDDYGNDIIED